MLGDSYADAEFCGEAKARRARTARRRSMELLLRCITHNIMVLEGTEP